MAGVNYSINVPAGTTEVYGGRFGPPIWRESMTDKTWAEISTNTLFNVDPGRDAAKNPNHPAAAPWAGVWTSAQQVDNDDVMAFSGAGYSNGHDAAYVYGGGHADYGGNEVYKFNVLTGAFSLLKDPAGSLTYPEESGVFVDCDDGDSGTVNTEKVLRVTTALTSGIYWDEDDGEPMPRSQHSYGNPCVHPSTGDLYVFVSANMFSATATSSADCFVLRASTNKWERFAQPTGTGASSYENGNAIWVESIGEFVWWANGNANLRTYNPTTDTWTTHSANLNLTGYKALAVDTTRNILIVVHSATVYAVDLTDLDTLITPTTFSGTPPAASTIHGWSYYEPLDAVFNWPGSGTSLNVLEPPAVGQSLSSGTWTWSTMTIDPSNTVTPPSSYASGWTYGRQFVSDTAKALIVFVDSGDQAQAFALPSTL